MPTICPATFASRNYFWNPSGPTGGGSDQALAIHYSATNIVVEMRTMRGRVLQAMEIPSKTDGVAIARLASMQTIGHRQDRGVRTFFHQARLKVDSLPITDVFVIVAGGWLPETEDWLYTEEDPAKHVV